MRVRFAPSPTGFLHVGATRTALFNWLAARHSGGVFILRSDDTDQERGSDEFYADILDGLNWLGLHWDEGIEVGGPYEPYRQSERLERYSEVAARLAADEKAYRCFCTAAELDERRKAAQAEGRPPGYDGRCRTLEPSEVAGRVEANEPAVLRLAVPRPGTTTFQDVVREEVSFDHEHVEDFVLLRSDGSPTYHLASTVDDVDFEITHVVRGEDLLSSTPKHILITEAMGAAPPVYAHVSLLLGPDGRKLSKRHGDTALHSYRNGGFLPEAVLNYLGLLGWSFGDDESIFSTAEMVERFELDDIQKNPAIFDNDKLLWMNGVYIRELELDDFIARTRPLVEADLGRELTVEDSETYRLVAPLIQERMKVLTEAPDQVRFLFVSDVAYDDAAWKKVLAKPEARVSLEGALSRLSDLGEWEPQSIEGALRDMLAELGLNASKGLQPLRVAITGSRISPPLFESLAALGKEESLRRLRDVFGRL
ncbi:MAG: glutamate--tRNA ligase [Acidimicrobiia bacterium]